MSFLKKLIKKKDEDNKPASAPSGVQAMSAELQMKYAKGVQYNMKIIIKGDRNVGKTTLFHRLQGQKFREEYLPTDEIQATSIQWNYKATDDVVKVEVWDVVDKGRRKMNPDAGLKMNHGSDDTVDQPCLDAQFVDVYKGTHAVILMFDLTKQWTWKYVEKELPNIPHSIPVIVLANHRDMGEHGTVEMDMVRSHIEYMDRGSGAASVRVAETSLLNGFGLKFLHRFFNVPFLKLQRDTLLGQMEANARETEALDQELDVISSSEEQIYDRWLSTMRNIQTNSQPRPVLSHTSTVSSNATASVQDLPKGPEVPENPVSSTIPKAKVPLSSGSVDDFQPDNSADDALNFFNEEKESRLSPTKKIVAVPLTDSDDDVPGSTGNPMVARFQDDLDSENEQSTPAQPKIQSADITLTSDEEDVKKQTSEEENTDADEECVEDMMDPDTNQHTTKALTPRTADRAESNDDDEVDPPVIAAFKEDISDEEYMASSRPTVFTVDKYRSDSENEVCSIQPATAAEEYVKLSSNDEITTKQPAVHKKKTKKKEKSVDASREKVKKKKPSKKSEDASGQKKKTKKLKPIDPLEEFLSEDVKASGGDYETL